MSRPCLFCECEAVFLELTHESVSDWVALNSGWMAEDIIVDVFSFEYSQRNCLFLNVIQPELSILT